MCMFMHNYICLHNLYKLIPREEKRGFEKKRVAKQIKVIFIIIIWVDNWGYFL